MGHQNGLIETLLSNVSNSFNNAANQITEFIDEIPGGFLIYKADESSEILYANNSLINIFKCDDYEDFLALTGGTFHGLVHPEDIDTVEKSINHQIKKRQDNMDYVEYRIICKDGTVRKVEDYGHFARTKFCGDIFYVFISDATEKLNRILKEHLQKIEIIEGLSINFDSILYVDLENDAVLPYRLSSRFQKQFGEQWQVRRYNELIKEYTESWVHADDRATILKSLSPQHMCQILSDSPTYYVNYRCIQDNKTIYLQLSIVNVSKENEVNKFVLGFRRIDNEILHEIKQKEILEEALKAAKLADVAKNAFLSNMSHDMRTPLNAIQGFLALTRKNLSDPEAAAKYLDCIEEAGNQILDLTAKVLEISDTQTQDFIVNEKAVNLYKIINDVYKHALSQAPKKNLRVSLNTDGIEHRLVMADGEKIKSILLHLISNAIKFNKNDGEIEIIASEKPHAQDNLFSYEITVKDTGVGINSDALERIFEPFEREYDTTASGVSGAGLGLTLAKQYAEVMGGAISVKSVRGEGSAFTLSVNLSPVQSNDDESDKATPQDVRGINILLVEDNEINLEIETDILQDAGFNIETAENGAIAVEKIKSNPPDKYDIILMDIQMPVMNGWDASAAIRSLEGARAEIPIIALSANAFERDKRISLEHGMNAHLTKPMDLEALKAIIVKILNEN